MRFGAFITAAINEREIERALGLDPMREGVLAVTGFGYRGREMAHQHLGMELLAKVKAEFADVAKVESEPRLEGRQMVMVMSPR